VAYTLAGRFGLWAWLALLYALLLGLVRIAVGGHFLSDVIASGFFVWIGWFMLAALICTGDGARCGEQGNTDKRLPKAA
jgi:membrane-associated phospholipid phosphatase